MAAYNDGYTGIGGFGYCHYLFVTDNSPLPWTACAFIAYMTCTEDGFSAWGKDMGGYSANPDVAAATEATYQHETGGYVDGDTAAALAAKGWNVFDTLQNNDAYHALQAVDGLIITGATGTNVNDVAVVLIGGEAQADA